MAVKTAFKSTLQWVQSHTKLCKVTIEPTQTKVHSGAWMYFSYRSGVRKNRKKMGHIIAKGQT